MLADIGESDLLDIARGVGGDDLAAVSDSDAEGVADEDF